MKDNKKFISKVEKPFKTIGKGLNFGKAKGKKQFKSEGLRF